MNTEEIKETFNLARLNSSLPSLLLRQRQIRHDPAAQPPRAAGLYQDAARSGEFAGETRA